MRGPAWLLAAALTPAAAGAATVLDFETPPAPATVTSQFSASGVLFNSGFLSRAPLFSPNTVARSGTQVMRVGNPSDGEFSPGPMVIRFTSPQARVRLFAGSEIAASTATLRAFDASDAVVATDGPREVAVDQFTAPFEVSTPTATIVRVELFYEDGGFEAFDDLELDGEPPAPVPGQAPVVTITSPPDGAELDVTRIDITGTAAGDGLLSPGFVTIDWLEPPEVTAPVFRSALLLSNSGTTRSFELLDFGTVPLGPITVGVEVENFGGKKGAASVVFENMPVAIRNRLAAEGGAAALGPFRFGLDFTGNCRMAVFQNGAISVEGDRVTTRVMRGSILGKWLALRGAPGVKFGCPLAEEGDSGAGGGSRRQDFAQGRIYATPGVGTFAVPAVFVDAIEKRGGEGATGVPIGDATGSIGVMQTWLFQRFARPDRPDLPFPSTLEIRGTPPLLWMERQSGDLSIDTSATIWESFPCADLLGPCTVEPKPPLPQPIADPGQKFCEGETFFPGLRGPREWENVRDRFTNVAPHSGDYRTTFVTGAVISSLMADTDLTLTHEWFYDCPPPPLRLPFDCPSDWLFKVRPYGPPTGLETVPQRDPDGRPTLFAGKSKDHIKVEYERFYGEFAGWMGFPQVGDLITAGGRWIIDCGHDSFRSELHPLFTYAKMKTVTSITDPFTGIVDTSPFGGQPGTRADVWVNGWYPGFDPAGGALHSGDPITFEIFPPPRPSPEATLVVNKPVDADAVAGVNLEWAMEPAGAVSHVRLRLTAPYREGHVTDYGEMIWEINRGYEGQWFVYWSVP